MSLQAKDVFKPPKPKRKRPEGQLVRACLDWLAERQIFAWRNNTGAFSLTNGGYVAFGYKGSPDIIGILPGGRFIGVEIDPGYYAIAVKRIQEELRLRDGRGPLMETRIPARPEGE